MSYIADTILDTAEIIPSQVSYVFPSPSAGAVFAVPGVSGLIFHLDANNESSMTLSSTQVVEWDDISGSGFSAGVVQLDQHRPNFSGGAVNGLGAVAFDFAGGSVYSYMTGVTPITNNVDTSIFVVAVTHTWGGSQQFILQLRETDADTDSLSLEWMGNLEPPGSGDFLCQPRDGNITTNMRTTTDSIDVGLPHVYSYVDASATDRTIYINGGNSVNSTVSKDMRLNQLVLGQNITLTASGLGFFGCICEVMVYDHALDGTARGIVEGYLTDKWGVQPV